MNLIGILTLPIFMMILTTYPYFLLSVFICTTAAESQICKFPIVTFEFPSDISLLILTLEHVRVIHESFLTARFELR